MSFENHPTLHFLPNQIEFMSSDDDRSCLLASVNIFGTDHHVMFIKVVDNNGVQEAASPEWETEYEAMHQMFDAPRFSTVVVPGYDGEYVVTMHPYED